LGNRQFLRAFIKGSLILFTFGSAAIVATAPARAQVIAQDAANNYTNWSNGNGDSPNNGSGFGTWNFQYGSGTQGAYENTSSVAISTGGDAFGEYANGGNSNFPEIGAERAFNTSMSSGDAFHITLQNNGVDTNGGSEGLRLVSTSTAALNINFTGGQNDWYIEDGTSSNANFTTNIPYAPNGVLFNVVLTGSGTYNLYATVPVSGTTTTFAYIGRSLSTSAAINSMTVYDMNNTAGGDFYFNSLAEVGTLTNSASTGNNWSTSSGWTSSFLPANGDNVAFSNASGGTTTNDLLNAVNSITFNSGAGSYTLANSSNAVLYVGQTGSNTESSGYYSIRNNSTSAQTISANLGLLENAVIDANAGNITISGVISDGANVNGSSTQAGALTKVGNNILALSGNNTYSGGTTINAGTLQANTTGSGNSATGSAGVTINSGGTLAGGGGATSPSTAGQISGSVMVTSGGTISAGTGASTTSSLGILNTGAQTWNSGGTYVAKTNGSSSDTLVMSSLIPVSGFNIALTGAGASAVTLQGGAPLVVAVVINGSSSTFSPSVIGAFNITTNNITIPAGYSLIEFEQQDTSFGGMGEDLVFEATPEPTSILLLGLAVSPLLLVRRRRRRAQIQAAVSPAHAAAGLG
jgi:autotransporter-associated beta strand protein